MRYTSFSICMGNLLCLTDASSSTLIDTREHWRDWKDSSEVSRASSTPFRTISRHPNMCSRSPLGPTQATKPPQNFRKHKMTAKRYKHPKIEERKWMTVLQKISKNSRYPPSSGSMILRWNIEVLEISNPVAQGKGRWGVIRLDQPRKTAMSWPECLALADCQWQCPRCYHPALDKIFGSKHGTTHFSWSTHLSEKTQLRTFSLCETSPWSHPSTQWIPSSQVPSIPKLPSVQALRWDHSACHHWRNALAKIFADQNHLYQLFENDKDPKNTQIKW